MINRDNLNQVVASIDQGDKDKINETDKEYCVLELSIFNVGHIVKVTLTDDPRCYAHVHENGDCLLEIEEVREILGGLE